MKFTYYPGCSLKGTGRAYEESLLPVLRELGVEWDELEDWNCCGATAYMAVDEVKSCVLAARNMSIAERAGNPQIIAPCSACYLVFNKAQHFIHDVPAIRDTVNKALKTANMTYQGTLKVRHPLDVLVNDVGLDAIKKRVRKPLKGLKVAPYYGCQIVRPFASFDDQYNPMAMDRLLDVLGATVVRYPLKTRCCGGSLTGTLPEPGTLCSYIILREAIVREADVIATVCSLCQFNLDGYRDQARALHKRERGQITEPSARQREDRVAANLGKIPVVFFTQLMGLAFGLSEEEIGLHRGFVPMKFLPAVSQAVPA